MNYNQENTRLSFNKKIFSIIFMIRLLMKLSFLKNKKKNIYKKFLFEIRKRIKLRKPSLKQVNQRLQ